MAHPSRSACRGSGERIDERSRHADPVLVLGEPLVVSRPGQVAPGQQVVLVGREDHAVPERLAEQALPLVDRVEHASGLSGRVRAHLVLVGVAADSERHCAHARQPWVPVQDPGQRVLEGGTVVDSRAHDDLSVHLDPPVQQHLEPAQAGRSLGVAQHLRPQLGIRGVDGDEERAEPLGQDPLGVELGEAGQGGEVPVEERQAVVVVLEVEAPPHPLGQLVDEAERTVVVAGPDPVEDGRGDLDPEGLSRLLVDPDQPGQRRPGAAHQDAEVARVAEALEIDDVAGLVPVQAQELVAHGQSGQGCRRRRGDRSHRGS